jgi:MGT family glycosyltransferase
VNDMSPERIASMVDDLVAGARADVPRIAARLKDDPVSAVCFDRMSPLTIGPILAAQAGVPDIATWPTLAFTEHSNPFRQAGPEASRQFDTPALRRAGQAMADLANEYGVDGRVVSMIGPHGASASALNIVFVAPAFQPDVDSFDETFRFVGPSLGLREDDPTWEPPGDERVIYVSLGTAFNNRTDIFRACLVVLCYVCRYR